MAKTALVTGASGQDAAYLAKFLLHQGYEVIGGVRRSSQPLTWRLEELGIKNDVQLVDLDLVEFSNVYSLLKTTKPSEVYNLAAQSFVPASFEQPIYTTSVNALGTTRLLESIMMIDRGIKFYQASTSEMFGQVREVPQTETTPFHPRSPYGVSKLYGHWITVNYRESYHLHASSGILFNHESPLRGENFVTKKITKQLAEVKYGLRRSLRLGNLNSVRDWGFAGDYVEGMWLMLQQESGDDYILATGESHSVKEFVDACIDVLQLSTEWVGCGKDLKCINRITGDAIVELDDRFFRPAEVDCLLGDPSKAEAVLGWRRKTSFRHLVEIMTVYEERSAHQRVNI